MGAPPRDTHKQVWMFRADESTLGKLKSLLGLQDGRTISIPEALSVALRIAVLELSREGYPRQGAPGPRSWEPGYSPPEGRPVYSPTMGTFTIGPFTSMEKGDV